MKRILVAGAMAVALVAAPHVASAAPFVGGIDYTGTHTPDNADLTVATESSIDFNVVVLAFDTFAAEGFLGTNLVHTSPLEFRPAGTPYTPLWTGPNGISFNLMTLTIVTDTANQLGLSGTGVFTGGGYDDTPGIWNMTLNNAGTIEGSFSSSSNVVPEPAMLALLGVGLIGVARRYARR